MKCHFMKAHLKNSLEFFKIQLSQREFQIKKFRQIN